MRAKAPWEMRCFDAMVGLVLYVCILATALVHLVLTERLEEFVVVCQFRLREGSGVHLFARTVIMSCFDSGRAFSKRTCTIRVRARRDPVEHGTCIEDQSIKLYNNFTLCLSV